MQLVIAAMSTAPSLISKLLCRRDVRARCRWRAGFLPARSSAILATLRAVRGLGRAQRHAVLRALRARERGLYGGEIELDHVGVVGRRRAVDAPQALRPGIGLDQRDLLGGRGR